MIVVLAGPGGKLGAALFEKWGCGLGEGEVAGFAGVVDEVEELFGAVAAVVGDVFVGESAKHAAFPVRRAEFALLGDGEGAGERFSRFDGRFEG